MNNKYFASTHVLANFALLTLELDLLEAVDFKYGLSYTLSSLVQELGKKEPQVKNTSC